MFHFLNLEAGHVSVWGMRTIDPDMDFENDLRTIHSACPAGALVLGVGQRLGGIGHYRTETGQPRFVEADGAYAFDTYVTTYTYANGQNTFAIQVFLSISETIGVSDSYLLAKAINLSISETVGVSSTTSPVKIAFFAQTETVGLHDAISAGVVMNLSISETIGVSDGVLTNIPLLSYVVNAVTGALVKYRNFNFNSYAHLNGKYYGIKDDGIYELDGDTDAGEEISATLTTGNMDFGSSKLKSIPDVYLGIKSTGEMILKVVAGDSEEYFYTMTPYDNSSLHSNRIEIGKGLQSRYWQFELSNVNGGDFDLDSIEFRIVTLSRRIVR